MVRFPTFAPARVLLFWLSLLLIPAAILSAADTPILKTGDVELGGFAGVVRIPNSGANAGGGGNIAFAANKYLYPYAEVSFMPVANTQANTSDFTYSVSGHYADFHGGLHVRVPIKGSRWVPYGVIAGGAFHSFGVSLKTTNNRTGASSSNSIPGDTVSAFNYGGGIRYYINERVGFRAEVKAYGPNSHFGGAIVRAAFGVFVQFNTHK